MKLKLYEEFKSNQEIEKICLEYKNQIFNPHKYNSFSELTERDLYEIAKWGLENDFSSSGAWDYAVI